MENFAYARAGDTASAIAALAPDTVLLAGGTELLNWMRLGIAAPRRVLDIGGIAELRGVAEENGRLRIGAAATLNEVGEHPAIARDVPVLAQACLQAASAQLRNLATLGGNLLQKTRCPYFRAEGALPWPCNKRARGSGCAALAGENRSHAIFGWSDACVATHPSDPAVALAALDAVVHVAGPHGPRAIAIGEFHRLPADAPDRDSALEPGELITHVEIDAAAPRSHYLKVRERASYEYAMVSAAAIVERDGDRIARARIALGSVAFKPWRLEAAEERLRGVALDPSAVREALAPAFAAVRPLAQNGFKVELARRAAVRALLAAGGAA